MLSARGLYRTAPENLILAQAQWPGMLTRYNYDDVYRLTAATRGMIAGQVDGDQDDHRHEDHHERSWSLGDKDRLQHPDWISSGWEHGWREPDGYDNRSDRAGKGGLDEAPSQHIVSLDTKTAAITTPTMLMTFASLQLRHMSERWICIARSSTKIVDNPA